MGFDVLRERLRRLVRSPLGEDRLQRMRLSSDTGWIRAELGRVAELQDVLRFDDPMPFRNVLDVRSTLARASPEGALLGPQELLDLQRTLVTLRHLRAYFEGRRERYAGLWALALPITPLPAIERRIEVVVDDDGQVRDSASAELQRLRRLTIRKRAALREALQQALRSAMRGGHTTEEQPTIRNGRMVIPVRAEAKRKVEGFVQDTSSSGQTVYIEPADCLDLNNEVRELEGEERREIDRILRATTSDVRDHIETIREGLRVLAEFDLLQAKARFANDLDAVVPGFNEDGRIEIVRGRNPVLILHFRDLGDEREVVPLDLSLGGDYHTLVITGPNAGGKTVAMKTVGLFAMMLGCGLPLPLDETSTFPIFRRLHVDIGDEQSIEEDLSTFSSHIANLKFMLSNAGRHALVLIDEAGTGTDPAEGGALAQAALESLTARGTRTIATTHHGTLKVFAHETEGVENGSMEFDQSTLSPTYRFQPGVPGSSYAFEIAHRIGLDESILDRARALVGEQKTALEELITTFEARTQELDAKLAEAEQTLRRARNERDQFERKARKIDREREDIRRGALEEAERIVGEANARIERTIREIKESEAEREATRSAREQLESFRGEMRHRLAGDGGQEIPSEGAEGEARAAEDAESGEREAAEPGRRQRGGEPREVAIEVGDQVVLDDGSTAAEVLEIDGDDAVLSFDSMRLRAHLDRLKKVGGKRRQQVRLGKVEHAGALTSLTAHSRLDLRGRRVHEALADVTLLIDEALVSGLDDVEILHGKGSGALRQAIHEYLAERPEVVSFEEAPWDQGGAGVTFVHLR